MRNRTGCNKVRVFSLMGYPASYRRASRSPQQRVREFLRNTDGFVRFPGMDRVPVGTGPFGVPTGDPVAPRPPLQRPPDLPGGLQPPDPATRPQQDIPWRERGRGALGGVFEQTGRVAGWALAAYLVANDYWPSHDYRFPYTPPPAGWTNICGPTGWPGPPYRNSMRMFGSLASANTGLCGLGGQSMAGLQTVPTASTRTLYYVWGPNTLLLPTERWFVDQMVKIAALPQPAPLTPIRHYPESLPSHAVTSTAPGTYNVIPTPQPLPSVPREQVAPTPYATTRGLTVAPAPAPRPRPDPGGLSGSENYPDVRPPPRERERKTDPRLGAYFRVLSQVGSWHSLVNALYRSLPKNRRTAGHSLQKRMQAIYQYYGEIDLGRAVQQLGMFWLRYRAAGLYYGALYKGLVKLYGPNRGAYIFRQMQSLGLTGLYGGG